jgi:pimeloyl-ACP methyl ester carboxylesterase
LATFVLVHPAWFGGWCWKKLTPLLVDAGHVVHTPTLTGLGERTHLASRDVGLETHIEDVTSLLEFEDLRDVIVVGNSSGGAVITGVADRAGSRIAQVVYLERSSPRTARASSTSFLPIVDRRWRSSLRKKATVGCSLALRPCRGSSSSRCHGRSPTRPISPGHWSG